MSQTSPVTESAPLAWRYEIQHGPDGETDYAWVYDLGNNLVCTTKTRHAIAIVDAMRGHAQRQQQPTAWLVEHRHKKQNDDWSAGGGSSIFYGQDRDNYAAHVAKLRGIDFVETVTVTPLYAGPSDTSTDRSPVMQAADKAAKVVEGWSDAKREYAGRVTDSSPNGNSK
jgi:hypothetical protein